MLLTFYSPDAFKDSTSLESEKFWIPIAKRFIRLSPLRSELIKEKQCKNKIGIPPPFEFHKIVEEGLYLMISPDIQWQKHL